MHALHCDHLVHKVRRLVIGRETAVPEGDLLQAFVDHRDKEAFAALERSIAESSPISISFDVKLSAMRK